MSPAADWRFAVAIGAAAGLAASPFWDPGGGWLRPLLALGPVVVLLADRGRAGWPALALIGLAAAIAGLLVGGARVESIDAGALDAAPGRIDLKGFATEPASESKGTARFAFDSDRGRVLIETSAEIARKVRPGSGLEIRGELDPAPGWMRPDLRRKGISMVLKAARIEETGEIRGGITGLIDRLRNRAFTALAVAVPERESALSRGFVLGDDSDVDSRTTENFRRSGLSHLLAVSGQNVVLLALLAMPLLALLGMGPRARLVALAALIVLYVPLAGGGPSIQRAGVMGIAGLVALGATRAQSRVYALALAAAVTLLLNPRATGDIGWQLSFAAVVGIMLLARPFQIRLEELTGSDGWRRALAEGMAVTLAATIATAPLTVFHFERFPVAGLIANLFAMPAVAPAMWLGMTGIAVGQLAPALAAPFNLTGSVCLAWIAQVAEWLGRPEWAVIDLKIHGLPALVLASGLLALVLLLLLRLWKPGGAPVRPGRWMPAAALLALLSVLLLPGLTGGDRRELEQSPPGGARVEVLDVGQGDAILIRPAGTDPVLIDGGPPDGDLGGALESAGVDHLAAVLLTHPDLDHYGGLLDVFGLLPVDRFLFDRAPPELVSMARSSGVQLERISQGQELLDGNIRLEILWPPAETGSGAGTTSASGGDQGGVGASADTETNLRSIVALLRWRNFRMLLTGDAEAESVPMDPGPIDVLKVSHHGSADAGLPALLDETSPRLAVISVGADNTYGHPDPDVLAELNAEGVRTLRTDEDGTVSIVLEPGGENRVETGR